MKKILVLVSLSFLLGCEFHEQSAYSAGSLIDSKFQLSSIDKLFAMVASNDYFGLEEVLTSEEVDLNQANNQGQLLLILAIKLKRDLITKLFLEHGADPAISDENNITGFDLVNDYDNSSDWIDLLEGKGLSKEYLSDQALNLISQAAEDSEPETIEKLKLYFQSGADVNARNERKYTLLIIAATKNLPRVVSFLCETEGVDIKALAGRYSAMSLTQRLLRRDPSLARIISILQRYES